ncbi:MULTISPECIES: substrate-binding domain-containing protein [Sphingomonas]|nr:MULTISPECIES: substrate-binding domain-containing protein [Sphingomonas]AGH49663.1 arabinose ABC transporter L-arabinose-binding periplasmic protein AraF [Sphingomonas sp. MM-1]
MAGTTAATAAALAGCGPSRDGRVRIGFVVKQPEEQWFQSEWRFAGMAARDKGFELIRIGAADGDRVLTAIDNLAAKNASGFVICAPDPRLGTAIEQRARVNDLKVMSVDDRLIGPDGKPIDSIPHVGISALAIGRMAGETAIAEARRREWDIGRTGVLRIAYDSLETGRDRTMGARGAIIAAGLPPAHVFDAPQRTTDTEGGFTAADPVLTRHPDLRHWIVTGLNDEAVLGGVRAAEGLGLRADSVIGVGIGGSGTAEAEFAKRQPTGFFASILLSPRKHGYDTSVAMYEWIVRGSRPPSLVYTDGKLMTRDNYRRLLAEEAA